MRTEILVFVKFRECGLHRGRLRKAAAKSILAMVLQIASEFTDDLLTFGRGKFRARETA